LEFVIENTGGVSEVRRSDQLAAGIRANGRQRAIGLLEGHLNVVQLLARGVQVVEAKLRKANDRGFNLMEIVVEIIADTLGVELGRLVQKAGLVFFVMRKNGEALGDGLHATLKLGVHL
jgi:hypothetical protein